MTSLSTSGFYQPVTAGIIAELTRIVGKANVLAGADERMQDYAHDEAAAPPLGRLPDAVVKPQTAAEIARIMQLGATGNMGDVLDRAHR